MNCEYVRNYYGVPACIGRKVMVYGKPGIIVEDRGNYIGVNLDTNNSGIVHNYHPTDGVEYLGMGKVRKASKARGRYLDFLYADLSCTFGEYLKNGWYKELT